MVELLVGPAVVVAAGSKTLIMLVLAVLVLRVLQDKATTGVHLEHWELVEQQVLVVELAE